VSSDFTESRIACVEIGVADTHLLKKERTPFSMCRLHVEFGKRKLWVVQYSKIANLFQNIFWTCYRILENICLFTIFSRFSPNFARYSQNFCL